MCYIVKNSEAYRAALADYTRSSRDVAKEFGVSKSTVNYHRQEMREEYSMDSGLVDQLHTSEGSAYTITSERAFGYEDFRNFIRARGQDPNLVDFEWGVTSNPAGGFWNRLNKVRPKKGLNVIELHRDELEARVEGVLAEQEASARKLDPSSDIVSHVTWSDAQIGKTGSRGGTPETLARGEVLRQRVVDWLGEQRPSEVVFYDGGDSIEGFESGGNPMFTNDLSLPRQLEEYTAELSRWLRAVNPDVVLTVPSNHAKWRYGKQTLGNPEDDFGISTHRIVSQFFQDTVWLFPDKYSESVSYNGVSLTHGHQFAPGRGIEWWKGQSFGSNAVDPYTNVLLHGHYHTFELRMAGVNPLTGVQRYLIGLSTTDNGSDWYRNKVGVESEPGVVVFNTIDGVLDTGSVRFIPAGF